jgi:hypothetical protein
MAYGIQKEGKKKIEYQACERLSKVVRSCVIGWGRRGGFSCDGDVWVHPA